MHKISITSKQLLAAYWLFSDPTSTTTNTFERLRKFVSDNSLQVSDEVIYNASDRLDAWFAKGDVEQWVVAICFSWHPHSLWNFMLDTVFMAECDEHLGKIACNLAEHILAHYGTMISHFEMQAKSSPKFCKMLTGVWRHRMSDDVWMRLRKMQASVSNPLTGMISLDYGVEYGSLKQTDRETDDKGRYFRNADGDWERPKVKKMQK